MAPGAMQCENTLNWAKVSLKWDIRRVVNGANQTRESLQSYRESLKNISIKMRFNL